jgi:CheY-like chemotaxis protein
VDTGRNNGAKGCAYKRLQAPLDWSLSGSAVAADQVTPGKWPETKAIFAYGSGTNPELPMSVRGRRTTMMTNPTTADASRLSAHDVARSTAQKVVIVNGSSEMLDLLESTLDAGHYDVVFVESSQHAYSQIKRVQPNLVILCVRIDDADGFQVLSMLKLDEATRGIPVLTYTTEYEGQDAEDDIPEPSDEEMFPSTPAVWMN